MLLVMAPPIRYCDGVACTSGLLSNHLAVVAVEWHSSGHRFDRKRRFESGRSVICCAVSGIQARITYFYIMATRLVHTGQMRSILSSTGKAQTCRRSHGNVM